MSWHSSKRKSGVEGYKRGPLELRKVLARLQTAEDSKMAKKPRSFSEKRKRTKKWPKPQNRKSQPAPHPPQPGETCLPNALLLRHFAGGSLT